MDFYINHLVFFLDTESFSMRMRMTILNHFKNFEYERLTQKKIYKKCADHKQSKLQLRYSNAPSEIEW